MPGIQRCRDRDALCGATSEPHVQCNAVSLENTHVFDQKTSHSLAFPVRQSRIIPNLPKVSCQCEDLLILRVIQHEIVCLTLPLVLLFGFCQQPQLAVPFGLERIRYQAVGGIKCY